MQINFAFTSDNSNVMATVDDTIKAFESLSQTMTGLGVKGDAFKDIETDVRILTEAIQENEKYIEEETRKLNELAEAQRAAASEGDTKRVMDLGVEMEELAENIQGVINETKEYRSALDTLNVSQEKVTESAEKNSGVMVKLLGGQEQYNSLMKILPGPLKKTMEGINGITKAGLKFIATPLGAVVLTLVLAFKALDTWLHKSAEGQKALAKITGYLNGVMMALEQVVMEVGKALYDAFTNPKEALRSFWGEFGKTMLNGFLGFLNLIKDVGKALWHISTFQFKKGDNDLQNIGNDLTRYLTGWDKDKADGTIKNINRIAKAESDLNARRKQLKDDREDWMVEEAEIKKRIAEERNRMSTGSEKERLDAARKVQELIDQKYARQIEFAQEEYNIQKEHNKLTWTSEEEEEAEKKHLAEIVKLEARRESEKGNSLRLEKSLTGAAAKTAEVLKEIAEKRDDMMREYGLEQADAEREARALVIDAMEDGYDKEKALLDHEHDERIEQIRKNYQQQLDTIEDLQKSEYKAKHGGSTKGFVFNPNDPLAIEALHASEAALDNENRRDENERTRLEKRILEERQANRLDYLKSYGTYKEKELAITEEYDSKIAKAEDEFAKKILTKEKEKDLYELQKQYSAVFELIFADASLLTDAQLAKAIEYTREEITRAANSSDVEKLTELYQRLDSLLSSKSDRRDWGFGRVLSGFRSLSDSRIWQTLADDESVSLEDRGEAQRQALESQAKGWDSITKGIGEVADTMGDLGKTMESFGGKVAKVGSALSALASKGSLVQKGMTAQTTGDRIAVAVQGTLEIIETIGSQIAANKKYQEQWNATVEQCTHAYTMMRLEALAYRQRNIFSVDNPYQKAIDSARLYRKAMEELIRMQDRLTNGQVQTGTKKVTNWSNVAKNAGSGAAAGAAVGSMINAGIGTAIGTAVGAVVGALTGFFGGREKVAVFESLSSQYDELFDPDTYELSDEVLADYNKLDDATKQIVDNWEDIRQAALNADKEMKQTIRDLSGDVGGNLRNALVDAFRNDDLYSAINTFHNQMTDTMEDIISQMIFSELFGDLFDELEEKMSQSFDEGGDNNIVDELLWFDDTYQERLEGYKQAMEDAQGAMESLGYDIFRDNDYEEQATRGSFQGMSQQMGAALEGRFTAIQIATQSILERLVQGFAVYEMMARYESDGNQTLEAIHRLHIEEAGYLKNIATQTAPLLELGDKLNIIASKL